ncbi:hypothetical protein [Streptomyces smaragdinus]|nr:hypothetical protein [Streptomyces smaragdinus]
MTAYLAGIAVNLTVASLAMLTLALVSPNGTSARIIAALVLISLLPLTFQCMIFMRTDLYFVLQDFMRCRNLYDDGRKYAAYLLQRTLHTGTETNPPLHDPSRILEPIERRAVRLYSIGLVAGTVMCLGLMAIITLPAEYTLLRSAISRLGPNYTRWEHLDAAFVLASICGTNALWAVTRWKSRAKRNS